MCLFGYAVVKHHKGCWKVTSTVADVFLLGAGFSRAIAAEMPLLADLNDAVWARVNIPEEKTFIRDFGGNIEMVLTYLSQSHPWLSEADNLRNRALFLDISVAVRDVLLDSMRQASRRPCPEWLKSLVEHWSQTHSNVITLNYDTLVESAARLCTILRPAGLFPGDYYPFPMTPLQGHWNDFSLRETDAAEVSSFSLFKLHGSINWLFSGSASFYGETIYYAALDDLWSASDDHRKDAIDRTPLIVPPVAEKVAYFQHPQVRGFWREAARSLESAQRVFCLGYSLPDLDLTMTFFLRRNHPVEIAPFYLVDTRDLRGHFEEMIQTGYRVDTKYVRTDEPIPCFVKELIEMRAV